MASILALVVGIRMPTVTFDPKEPFSGPRAMSKVGLIFFGVFGVLLFIALIVVSLLKK
jgi:hypothetical protein